MLTNLNATKIKSKLRRVRIDDTLMTIMLLNDEPIIAVASSLLDDEADSSRESGFCHIVRIDDAWAEA